MQCSLLNTELTEIWLCNTLRSICLRLCRTTAWKSAVVLQLMDMPCCQTSLSQLISEVQLFFAIVPAHLIKKQQEWYRYMFCWFITTYFPCYLLFSLLLITCYSLHALACSQLYIADVSDYPSCCSSVFTYQWTIRYRSSLSGSPSTSVASRLDGSCVSVDDSAIVGGRHGPNTLWGLHW